MRKVNKKDTTNKLTQRDCSAFKVYFEHIQYNIPDINLTVFWLLFQFYNPEKNKQTKDFLVFPGGVKWEHWPEIG